MFLLIKPSSSQLIISKNLKKNSKIVSIYLNKLIELDIIENISIDNEVRYKIKNNNYISDLIIKYEKSFFR